MSNNKNKPTANQKLTATIKAESIKSQSTPSNSKSVVEKKLENDKKQVSNNKSRSKEKPVNNFQAEKEAIAKKAPVIKNEENRNRSKVDQPQVESPQESSPRVKKKNVAGKIFGWTLFLSTVGFGYVIADYFYFDPVSRAGQPVYGSRLEGLKILNQSILDELKQGINETKGIASANTEARGGIVYVSAVVEQLELEDAQKAVETAISDVLKKEPDCLTGYNVQLMLTQSNSDELLEQNRDAESDYVKQHKLKIVETIISHTEKYPTAENMQRSQANINILNKKYPEEAAEFQSRIDALKEYTAEEEAALEIPTLAVDQTVPTSDLADFPSWGVYNLESSTATWY